MAKKPETPNLPPLVDSLDAKEIFVSEVVGTGVIAGCISVNLACHRWTASEGGAQPEFTRVMVARLVLSGEAATQLTHHLANLAQQTKQVGEAQAAAAKSDGNGKPAAKN